MHASVRLLSLALAAMLATTTACKSGKSVASQSTRWSDLSSNFQSPGTQQTENPPANDSKPRGSEHFRNVAGPKPPVSLNFQPVLDQQQMQYEAPGPMRLPDDSWIERNQKWKQHWRDNPNDSPTMHRWYKDDFR